MAETTAIAKGRKSSSLLGVFQLSSPLYHLHHRLSYIGLHPKGKLPFMAESGRNTWSSAWGRTMSQLRAEGSWSTLWWVGVCYGPPDEEEEGDEAFFTQLEEASCLQALVLMADLNYANIC